MLVECPSCKCRFTVKSGRPVNKISAKNLLAILREVRSVKQASLKLNCSKDTIKKQLKYLGIDPKSITGRKYTKRSEKTK